MTLESIPNFLRISPALATGGQPTQDQLEAIGRAGYQSVINLATPTSRGAIANEGEIVTAQRMTYVHIPVPWAAPEQRHLDTFMAVMNACAGQPVFVHCALNMRVSAFVYLYRTLHEGTPEAEARRDLERIWQPDGIWQSFIEQAGKQAGSAPSKP